MNVLFFGGPDKNAGLTDIADNTDLANYLASCSFRAIYSWLHPESLIFMNCSQPSGNRKNDILSMTL